MAYLLDAASRYFPDAPLDLFACHLAAPEPEGDVVEYVEVRKESVRLEDRVDVPLVGGQVGDVPAVELDGALRRFLEAADDAERGRLPAARRTEHAEELSATDLEIEVIDGDHAAERLDYLLQGHHRIAGRGRSAAVSLPLGHSAGLPSGLILLPGN